MALSLFVLAAFCTAALAACDGKKLGDGLPETADCASCHGNPPAAPHPAAEICFSCHPGTVTQGEEIDEAGGQHANGAVEFAISDCGACHGNPPAASHPLEPDCFLCHPATVTESG